MSYRGLNLRVLGLAVMAALAAMAFMGAGSASATTLCKVTPTEANACPSGQEYPANTKVEAELEEETTAFLDTNTEDVTCTVSKSVGESTAKSGEPLPGKISNLTFENCKTNLNINCTVTTVNKPYNAQISATSEGNGTLTAVSSGEGNPGATVVCLGGVINCTFTSPAVTLDVEGGAPSRLYAEEETLNQNGLSCPKTSLWTATYVVTNPTEGWVAATP